MAGLREKSARFTLSSSIAFAVSVCLFRCRDTQFVVCAAFWKGPSLAVARQALILHLQRNADNVVVHTFDGEFVFVVFVCFCGVLMLLFVDWSCKEFISTLDRLNPGFVLLCDGDARGTRGDLPDLRVPLQTFALNLVIRGRQCVRSSEVRGCAFILYDLVV